jgi:hypothetical protein
MALQHLRSSTADKRPTPGAMADGQLAMNTNLASPGLFFKDSNGDLVKVGPVHIGTTAPNATPASGGQAGNSKGEQWLDTSGANPVLKIWDGSTWQSEAGEFVNASGDTMTGALVMDNQQQVRFRETTANGTNYIAIQAPASVAADRTLTLPDVDGTLVSSGDTGTVTSTMIADGTIVDADVNASAAIAGTKISPDFGSQTVQTTGIFSHALGTAAAPTVTFTGDTNTGLFSPGADQLALSTAGTSRLHIASDGKVGVGTSSPDGLLTVDGETNIGFSASGNGGWLAVRLRDGTAANAAGSFSLRSTASSSEAIPVTQPNLLLRRNSNNAGTFLAFTNDRPGYSGIGSNTSSDNQHDLRFFTGAGTEQLRITGAGNVGIGDTAPDALLTVNGVGSFGAGSASAPSIAARGDLNTGMFFPAADTIAFAEGGSEAARIDSSGRLLVGTTSGSGSQLLKVQGNTTGSTNGGAILLSRGQTSISSGELLGQVRFGDSNDNIAAQITARADGAYTAGSNQLSRLEFSTTADGASSPTERARLTSTGALLVGTSTTPTGAAAGAVVANTQVVIGGRTNYQYAGSTSIVTASTGTVVFKFKSNSIGSVRACFVNLSFFARANSATPADSPAAQYAFQLHHTSANVSTLNGATSIFEFTFVRATHFAFADLGGGECTVTLTNPTALELRPGYKVEIINAETASVWNLDTVTVT